MKHLFKSTLLALAIIGITSGIAVADIKPVSSSNAIDKNLEYAFVMSSQYAKLVQSKTDNDTYTLTLENVKPYVYYFSDRPHRITGTVPMNTFVGFWKGKDSQSFGKDLPNAGISGVDRVILGHDHPVGFFAELASPSYDAKKNELSYQVHIIGNQQGKLSKEISLRYASLYIDPFCLTCEGP